LKRYPTEDLAKAAYAAVPDKHAKILFHNGEIIEKTESVLINDFI